MIEEVIEPYLLQQGLIGRTPRGRVLSAAAYRYMRLPAPREVAQLEMLAQTYDEEMVDDVA